MLHGVFKEINILYTRAHVAQVENKSQIGHISRGGAVISSCFTLAVYFLVESLVSVCRLFSSLLFQIQKLSNQYEMCYETYDSKCKMSQRGTRWGVEPIELHTK